jgi:hypothetical protein
MRSRILSLAFATTLALSLMLSGCAAPQATPELAINESWTTHSGQLLYRSRDSRSVIGDFVVRQSRGAGFVIHFSSGPGIPLLKLQRAGDRVTAEGVMARGRWAGRADAAPPNLRSWTALEGAFAKLGTGAATLTGSGWTAQKASVGGAVQNLKVTFPGSGEEFVFHFSR